MIPESHALQGLFAELVHDHFDREVGLRDAEVQDYIANVLSEFCEAEQLYKVRNAEGRALSDVGEMLLETDPIYGPRRRSTVSARCANMLATTFCFCPACFPRASITFACGGSGWRILSTS